VTSSVICSSKRLANARPSRRCAGTWPATQHSYMTVTAVTPLRGGKSEQCGRAEVGLF
jgi:hypothetical protein